MIDDAVSAGDFPGKLLDSREGIYVASLLVAALVPFVRRAFVELVAEVSGGKEREILIVSVSSIRIVHVGPGEVNESEKENEILI